jgi:hypothetical protein
LTEHGAKLAILPRAVRDHEIEQPALFARHLPGEQRRCAAHEFEKPNTLVKIGSVPALVIPDPAKRRS